MINYEAGLSGIDGRIVCFGDSNGDRSVDVFVLNSAQDEISILLWNTGKYELLQKLKLDDVKLFKRGIFTTDFKFVNAIAADFNQDGVLDILAIIESSLRQTTGMQFVVFIQQDGKYGT